MSPENISSNEPVYNERGFVDDINHQMYGVHRNGSPYDDAGFDIEGYDRELFHIDGYTPSGFGRDGIHRDTGTPYNPEGYNADGYNADGRDSEGYNEAGFDNDGIHRDTGTEFNRFGRTDSGNRYNSEGYDVHGYDSDGYDSDGYDSRGFDCDGIHRDTGSEYDEEGYDVDGNSPRDDFDGYLCDYGTDVLDHLEWAPPIDDPKALLAGHEIEMYSPDCDTGDVDGVLSQLRLAYLACGNVTTLGGSCAIAKHDGSLDCGGFETVTVPLTPSQTYKVFESFETLGNGSCSAWGHGNSVGHHIHVSRAAMSRLTEGKIGVFLNLPDNRSFIEFIAQREARYNAFEDRKRLTRPEPSYRHAVLNVTGETLEFRLFKSNLRTSGILKNYEFCVATVCFCRQASHQRLRYEDFMRCVVENYSQYRYLHRFMYGRSNTGTFREQYRLMVPKCAIPRKVWDNPAA